MITSVEQKGFTFFEIAAIVSQEGGAAHTINLCKKVVQGKASEAR